MDSARERTERKHEKIGVLGAAERFLRGEL